MKTSRRSSLAALAAATGLVVGAFAAHAAYSTPAGNLDDQILINKPHTPITSDGVELASMYTFCWRDNYVEAGYAGCTTLY